MYFWNTRALINDFKRDRVDDGEKFKYLLAWFVSLSLSVFIKYFKDLHWGISGVGSGVQHELKNVIEILFLLAGIILAYSINRAGDNRDFNNRLICISWPIYFKLLILSLTSLWVVLKLTQLAIGNDFIHSHRSVINLSFNSLVFLLGFVRK